MRLLCIIGIHNYAQRDVHLCEEWRENPKFMAQTIFKCDCGSSKLGKKMVTRFVISEKYLDHKQVEGKV